MKIPMPTALRCLLLALSLLAGPALAADNSKTVKPPSPIDISLGHEIQNAIDRGLASLLASLQITWLPPL
jgi:hypothetical protein